MLETAGCEDVTIDYNAKTATMKVPATVKDDQVEKAVTGKFSASVKQ